MSKVDSQEHPAAAQSIDHPIVKNTRPEYPSADERINVFSLSAIHGGDRSDTSQSVYKVYRRFVHCLKHESSAVSVRVPGTGRKKKKRGSWEVPGWNRKYVPIVPSLIEHLSIGKNGGGAPLCLAVENNKEEERRGAHLGPMARS